MVSPNEHRYLTPGMRFRRTWTTADTSCPISDQRLAREVGSASQGLAMRARTSAVLVCLAAPSMEQLVGGLPCSVPTPAARAFITHPLRVAPVTGIRALPRRQRSSRASAPESSAPQARSLDRAGDPARELCTFLYPSTSPPFCRRRVAANGCRSAVRCHPCRNCASRHMSAWYGCAEHRTAFHHRMPPPSPRGQRATYVSDSGRGSGRSPALMASEWQGSASRPRLCCALQACLMRRGRDGWNAASYLGVRWSARWSGWHGPVRLSSLLSISIDDSVMTRVLVAGGP